MKLPKDNCIDLGEKQMKRAIKDCKKYLKGFILVPKEKLSVGQLGFIIVRFMHAEQASGNPTDLQGQSVVVRLVAHIRKSLTEDKE